MRIGVVLLITCVFLAGGCGSALVRVAPPGPGSVPAGPPKIEEAIDLGGLPIPEQGELSTDHKDARFTPGEWVALKGENLADAPKISVNKIQVPVAGYLEGGSILIRVPRGLPPGNHTLTVQTAKGSAAVALPTRIHAFGADTNGDAIRIRRIGPGSGGFEDEELDIKLDKARFQVLSPDGAILYAIQKPEHDTPGAPSKLRSLLRIAKKVKGGPAKCQLIVVHLGAKGRPQQANSIELTLSSKPTGMTMGPRGPLVILQKRQLTVLDVSDPLRPRETATLVLASKDQMRGLIDAAFLEGGRWLAVLEAYENRVHVVDFSNPARPRLAGGVNLSRAMEQPFSIDLVLSRDGRSLWVLQGPNLRLAGKRLLDGLKALLGDVKQLEFKQAAGSMGGAVTSAAMRPQEGLSRLVQVTLQGGQPSVAKSIPLPPDLFPFFVQPDREGALYVSGINRGAGDFSKLELSLSGLRELLKGLKTTAQVGRVLKVSAEDGSVSTALQGMAVYYDLALLPSGRLLVSTVRLGPGYLPPRLTLDWGFEIAGGPFVKLREVANTGFGLKEALKKLMPPYSYERIGTQ